MGIWKYLKNKIEPLDNPKQYGKALRYDMIGLWRYRMGKYRMICEIKDKELIILVITIKKRDKVYD